MWAKGNHDVTEVQAGYHTTFIFVLQWKGLSCVFWLQLLEITFRNSRLEANSVILFTKLSLISYSYCMPQYICACRSQRNCRLNLKASSTKTKILHTNCIHKALPLLKKCFNWTVRKYALSLSDLRKKLSHTHVLSAIYSFIKYLTAGETSDIDLKDSKWADLLHIREKIWLGYYKLTHWKVLENKQEDSENYII